MDLLKYEEMFAKYDLSDIWKTVKSTVKNSIRLHLEKTEDSLIKVGASKIGGSPDLINESMWPKNGNGAMSFICQLNLQELSEYDTEYKLPKVGLLSFFYDNEQSVWGFDPEDRNGFEVLYIENILDLKRLDQPNELSEYGRFASGILSFSSELNFPNFTSNLFDSLKLSQKQRDKFFDLIAETEDDLINKALGHSNNIQGGMELECELVTNGLKCGDPSGYNDPKAKELEKNVGDWNLLLQIDSNEELDMMWGDCGRIFYWIKNDNLSLRQFDKCWFSLQCF